MSYPFRVVAGGLSTARVGLFLTIALVGVFTGLFLASGVWPLNDYLSRNPGAWAVYAPTTYGVGIVSVVSLVVGFVGRCRCLATPHQFTTTSTRIRLAVLLEGCGLLSGFVSSLAAVFVARFFGPVVPGIVIGTSVLALIAGRLLFLVYLRSLADLVGDESLLRLASRSHLLLVIVTVCGVTGVSLFSLTTLLPHLRNSRVESFALASGSGLCVAGAIVGAIGLFVYGRLLRRSAASVLQLVEGEPATVGDTS